MAADPGSETSGPAPEAPSTRLRFTSRSLVGAVALVSLTFALAHLFPRAARPLSWLLVACIVAALLLPAVGALVARRVPKTLAVILVLVACTLVLGGIVGGGVVDLEREADRLRGELPSAARELEESRELGELARALDLEERTRRAMDDLPSRLVGGTDVEALQADADHGAAFLVTAILALFMLAYGPRFYRAGLEQLRDPDQRERVDAVLTDAFRGSWRYLAFTTAKAFVAGAFTVAVCLLADVQAAVLLGIWVALWSFVPALGVVVGSIPVVLAATLTSFETALVVLVAFIGYQLLDVLVAQPRIDRSSLRVGPALTLVVGVVGFDLYGVGGLVVAVILLVFALGVARAWREPQGDPEAAAAGTMQPA